MTSSSHSFINGFDEPSSAYDLPCGKKHVDGMDVLAVKQACKACFEEWTHCESAFITHSAILEMDTYRYHGHSMSDPGSTYRTRGEITGERQECDPIERIRKLVRSHDLAIEKELKALFNNSNPSIILQNKEFYELVLDNNEIWRRKSKKEVDEAIAKAKDEKLVICSAMPLKPSLSHITLDGRYLFVCNSRKAQCQILLNSSPMCMLKAWGLRSNFFPSDSVN
ncbi:hypothetical protein HYC85_023264 [Camellia sinensis]|uniref:Dehydrogenase E1 component domain-containing protein n=1 Tax=Camellia sinensis TaxID=4442 RepID=A0A7J7GF93_CAMSI|nr:hypothetical protein HYC85_023264 [Camellia sinensis]